jgi:pantoate kinase
MATELSGSHSSGQLNEAIDASAVNDILMAGDKSKGARPYFFEDPAVERVLNIAMAVATEVAVVRERMDTIERLLESKGVLLQSEIENFVPTDEQAEERQLWHARFAARIMRIVQQEVDAIAKPENNVPMRKIADDINEM